MTPDELLDMATGDDVSERYDPPFPAGTVSVNATPEAEADPDLPDWMTHPRGLLCVRLPSGGVAYLEGDVSRDTIVRNLREAPVAEDVAHEAARSARGSTSPYNYAPPQDDDERFIQELIQDSARRRPASYASAGPSTWDRTPSRQYAFAPPGGTDPAEVERKAAEMRHYRAARKLVDAEEAAADPAEPFDSGTLTEMLARPDTGPTYRADGIIPANASTTIVAQNKAGKSTSLGNLARSLITGEPFLDRFDVDPITGRFAVLNYEVDGRQAARWYEEIGVPEDRVYFVNLRGRRNPLSHPGDRERLAKELRDAEVETVAVDPFGQAFPGENQNDSGEVSAFLRDLDRFARSEVGATDLILTVHAGWGGDRTRGSSALEDWPDSIITLTKDVQGTRYLKARGRDVDIEEDALSFDPETRRLSMTGDGSRREVTDTRHIEQVTPSVVAYVNAHPGCSQNAVEHKVAGNTHQIRNALRVAAETGQIHREKVGGKWILGPPRPGSATSAGPK